MWGHALGARVVRRCTTHKASALCGGGRRREVTGNVRSVHVVRAVAVGHTCGPAVH